MKNSRERTSAERGERSEREAPARAAGNPENSILAARGLMLDGLGNRAILALLRQGQLQRKARVSQRGDPLEHEAEEFGSNPISSQASPLWHQLATRVQAKLAVSSPDDPYEREADRVADRVMRMAEPVPIGSAPAAIQRQCAECEDEENKAIQTKRAPTAQAGAALDTAAAVRTAERGGAPLSRAVRSYFEPRFGYDFSGVRVHTDGEAAVGARAVRARAYTIGRDIVFGHGQYAPATVEGRRLLAHELTHVAQQQAVVTSPDFWTGPRSAHSVSHNSIVPEAGQRSIEAQGAPVTLKASPHLIQRQPDTRNSKDESDYKKLVAEKKWCRDSEESGKLHPGQQCYREIPPSSGYPSSDQMCFDSKTHDFVESSPDCISPVSGQKADGTCDIPLNPWHWPPEVPQPFTLKGRRALGHAICDVAREDPDQIGKYYGRLTGYALDLYLLRQFAGSRSISLGRIGIPAALSFASTEFTALALAHLSPLLQKRGFLPTLDLRIGKGLGFGTGFEKRDKPLLGSLYPKLEFLTEVSTSTTLLANAGLRFGGESGLYATGSVGAGVEAGKDVSGIIDTEVGLGYRFPLDFIDVKLVKQTVYGGNRDSTVWFTVELVAPRRVLHHPKSGS